MPCQTASPCCIDQPWACFSHTAATQPLPPQASILHYAKQITEAQSGGPVPDAVITVPAWFGIAQRQALINAASLAGVNVLALINTHAAAALQFGIERDFADKEQKVRQGYPYVNSIETHLEYPPVCKACSCALLCALQDAYAVATSSSVSWLTFRLLKAVATTGTGCSRSQCVLTHQCMHSPAR